MQYLIHLSDASSQHMVVLTLPETAVNHPAIDLVFEVIGSDAQDEFALSEIVSEGQLEDLKAIQEIIFDNDSEGIFIRDGISLLANGKPLDPDKPMISSFVPAERDGTKYMRCNLVVEGGPQAQKILLGQTADLDSNNQADQIKEFSRIFFLHMVAAGPAIDVTKEYPELANVLPYAEQHGLVEVDVKLVRYKLSEEGLRQHDALIAETQDLIRRYDIYADVELDSSGRARFDTGLGKDLRIPAFEMEGVDPFRARFLLGLNDGEWNNLSNWMELFEDPDWYARMFEPIEQAPSIDEIGRDRMANLMDQARTLLRQSQN